MYQTPTTTGLCALLGSRHRGMMAIKHVWRLDWKNTAASAWESNAINTSIYQTYYEWQVISISIGLFFLLSLCGAPKDLWLVATRRDEDDSCVSKLGLYWREATRSDKFRGASSVGAMKKGHYCDGWASEFKYCLELN